MYDNGTIIVTMAACIIIVIIDTASGIMYHIVLFVDYKISDNAV